MSIRLTPARGHRLTCRRLHLSATAGTHEYAATLEVGRFSVCIEHRPSKPFLIAGGPVYTWMAGAAWLSASFERGPDATDALDDL